MTDVTRVPPLIKSLARDFDARLRETLTVAEYDAMWAANRAEPNPNVCHSHDYCDANMVMHDTLRANHVSERQWDAVWDYWRLNSPESFR